MGFIYGADATRATAQRPRDRGTAYHALTLLSTEYQVGNQCPYQVTAPGLQFTQVDPLTAKVGIVLGELRQEVQILISIPSELDCLTPGNGAVSVRGWIGHEVVCLLHVSYHISGDLGSGHHPGTAERTADRSRSRADPWHP